MKTANGDIAFGDLLPWVITALIYFAMLSPEFEFSTPIILGSFAFVISIDREFLSKQYGDSPHWAWGVFFQPVYLYKRFRTTSHGRYAFYFSIPPFAVFFLIFFFALASTEKTETGNTPLLPGEDTPTIQSQAPNLPPTLAKKVKSRGRNYKNYIETDKEIGCLSKYSEAKKVDIFQRDFYLKWMQWEGEVLYSDADNASLNLDNGAGSDLKVYFSKDNAGYHLEKGDVIRVRFLLASPGGCFSPFVGEEAYVL